VNGPNNLVPNGIIPAGSMDKVPLVCRVYRDPQGQPLKSALANKFPLLSRRERRELRRQAIKAHKKAMKAAKAE
jgi:hypothetical protein